MSEKDHQKEEEKEPLSLPVQDYIKLARKHWKEFRPKMYRKLQKSGQLEQALQNAAERTLEVEFQILENLRRSEKPPKDYLKRVRWETMKAHQAWELVREQWLLLPSEEDVPVLGENPPSK